MYISKDKSAKDLLVRQYVHNMVNWLEGPSDKFVTAEKDKNQSFPVSDFLGNATAEKEKYVRFLIAYLTCDYVSMKKFRLQSSQKKVVCNIELIDVFGNDFQKQMDKLLRTIGLISSCEDGSIKRQDKYETISTGINIPWI